MSNQPPTMVSVQRARPQDYDAIAELNLNAYQEFAAHVTGGAWERMRANLCAVESVAKRAVFLVVRVDGELAGSVAYCPAGKSDPKIFPHNWASVLLLAVAPQYRGRRIAKQLIHACLQLAREDGTATVGLFTSELMVTARRMYESMGFLEDSEIPPRHGLRYWRYRLDLNKTEE